jgi:hypothetical protein
MRLTPGVLRDSSVLSVPGEAVCEGLDQHQVAGLGKEDDLVSRHFRDFEQFAATNFVGTNPVKILPFDEPPPVLPEIPARPSGPPLAGRSTIDSSEAMSAVIW